MPVETIARTRVESRTRSKAKAAPAPVLPLGQILDGDCVERLRELPDAETLKDAKTRLQEALQRDGRPLPEYAIVEVTGEQHRQHMRATCVLADSEQVFEGSGSSRRKAEQDAARACLEAVFQLVAQA